MVKIKVTDRGIIAEPGSGFEGTTTSASTQTKTANSTMTSLEAGVTILSASQGVITTILPPAASSAGAMHIFRSTSPSAHVLTSSQDAGNVICAGLPGDTGNNASNITFPAVAGSCVILTSTGAHWAILSTSGTMTLTKGAP